MRDYQWCHLVVLMGGCGLLWSIASVLEEIKEELQLTRNGERDVPEALLP